MSAIFGFYSRDGQVDCSEALERMSVRLDHRGPDASGVWCGESVGLGQKVLYTTPESLAEDGPLLVGGHVIVADARIDNRAELIAMMGLRDRHALTDGELILHAYQKWGRAAPEKLLGDFAFAIWDPNRRLLFCARDPMGVRPFYYHASDRLFAFATEMGAVLCLPGIPRELDEVQVAHFLRFSEPHEERTLYRAVRRLPAAHWMEVEPNRQRMGRYWAADPHTEIRYGTDEEYAEAFRDLFTAAVRCRLRSAFPIGAALSGGLDSSSVVCTARRLMGEDRPLPVVSAVFPGLPEFELRRNDESHYIEAVVAMGGIESHRVRADEVGVFDYLDRYFWHHGAAPFAFMLWMRWEVYKTAHDQGIRVFLSGDDGDTVVSHGYGRFYDLIQNAQWETIAAEIQAMAIRMRLNPVSVFDNFVNPNLVRLLRGGKWRQWRTGSRILAGSLDFSRTRHMARSAFDAFVPDRWIDLSRRMRGIKAPSSLMRPEFARRVELEEREDGAESRKRKSIPTGRESHASLLPSPGLQYLLEITDSIAGAFSIETRCPFLDRRLVEFSLALPSEQKLADGWTRIVLRRAMEGILPPEVQWRVGKADLVYNFIRRLREQDREQFVHLLFDEPRVLEDYVDMDSMRSMYERFDSGGPRGARGNSGQLYIAAVLSRWLREHHGESQLGIRSSAELISR